jgi:hypothetical protein
MDEYDMYDGGDDWNDNDGYYQTERETSKY